MKRVDWLIAAGVIPVEKHDRWDIVRGLRNETTHASIRHLTTRTKRCACSNSWPARSTRCSLPSPAWTQTRPSREIAGEIVAPSATPDNLKIVVWAGFPVMPEEGLEPPTRGL